MIWIQNLPQSNSQAEEKLIEIAKYMYRSPEKRQYNNDDPRLIYNIKMEYEKNNKLVRQYTNQSSKFRRKYWIEINNDSRGTHNTDNQVKFKTTILKSNLCDYDVYILIKWVISVANMTAASAAAKNNDKVFKTVLPLLIA